jgi:hypothetical protein
MIPALQKYPQEIRTATFDFRNKLTGGDSLSGTISVTASAGLTLTGPTVSAPLGQAYVHVSGGAAGNDYEVRCEVGTTNGDYLREVVRVEVRDDAN